MARHLLNALLTEKALSLVSARRNSAVLDLIADNEVEHNVPLKNVCAKVHRSLSDEIDEVVSLLGISKRQFLEAAFIEAIRQAHEVMDAEGVWERLDEDHSAEEGAA